MSHVFAFAGVVKSPLGSGKLASWGDRLLSGMSVRPIEGHCRLIDRRREQGRGKPIRVCSASSTNAKRPTIGDGSSSSRAIATSLRVAASLFSSSSFNIGFVWFGLASKATRIDSGQKSSRVKSSLVLGMCCLVLFLSLLATSLRSASQRVSRSK